MLDIAVSRADPVKRLPNAAPAGSAVAATVVAGIAAAAAAGAGTGVLAAGAAGVTAGTVLGSTAAFAGLVTNTTIKPFSSIEHSATVASSFSRTLPLMK